MRAKRLVLTLALAVGLMLLVLLALGMQSGVTQAQALSMQVGRTGGDVEAAGAGVWTPLGGPSLAGGDARALAVHPAISGTLYAAVQAPGADWDVLSKIYVSTDGAANWTAIYTAPHRIMGLAVTDTVIYAGAYNRDGANLRPVIYRSADGGLSWTPALSIADGVIWALDVHPTLTQTAIAGGGDYPDQAMLYQTTDGGATWTESFSYTRSGWAPTVNAALIHPTTPLTWLLSHDGEVDGTFGGYIYRSTDGGANWTEVYSATGDFVASLVANPVTPTTIYAGSYNNNFYRSNDGGVTWVAVVTDGSAGESLVLDPPDTLYAVRGSEVRRSTDEGDSWGIVGNVPDKVMALAIDLGPTSGALYAGLGLQGVYKSSDGGANWEGRNNGIETLVLSCDIDVDPQNLDRMFAAAAGGGGWMTTNGGETWTQPSGIAGHMGAFAINPEDPNIVYGGAYDCSRGAVLRSEDGGLNFEPVYTATFIIPDCSGGDETIDALAIAPSVNSTVYAAGADHPNWGNDQAVVVRCLDDGASCTEVFTRPAQSRVRALAVNPISDTVVYAGGQDCSGGPCEGFIYRTTDGGDNWTLVFTTTSTVRSIVVDHQKPDVLYASDDGYRVYKSADSGDHWTTVRRPPWEGGGISGNLLAIDPQAPSHLYLGGGGGYVGESTDGGQTWSGGGAPLSQGTPVMEPTALAVDNGTPTQTLYAAFTGVWAHTRLAPQPGTPVTVTAWASAPSAQAGTAVAIGSLQVDLYENWVADGTMVTFTTSPVGSFASTTVVKTTTDGRAEATLTGVMSGTAAITVTSGTGMDTLTVDFTAFKIYLPLVLRGS
jgi:photosystem II stability/assembly factor-like uncharacterized protein